jgi:hypothetical protein
MNFVAFGVIAEIDDMYASSLRYEPLSNTEELPL